MVSICVARCRCKKTLICSTQHNICSMVWVWWVWQHKGSSLQTDGWWQPCIVPQLFIHSTSLKCCLTCMMRPFIRKWLPASLCLFFTSSWGSWVSCSSHINTRQLLSPQDFRLSAATCFWFHTTNSIISSWWQVNPIQLHMAWGRGLGIAGTGTCSSSSSKVGWWLRLWGAQPSAACGTLTFPENLSSIAGCKPTQLAPPPWPHNLLEAQPLQVMTHSHNQISTTATHLENQTFQLKTASTSMRNAYHAERKQPSKLSSISRQPFTRSTQICLSTTRAWEPAHRFSTILWLPDLLVSFLQRKQQYRRTWCTIQAWTLASLKQSPSQRRRKKTPKHLITRKIQDTTRDLDSPRNKRRTSREKPRKRDRERTIHITSGLRRNEGRRSSVWAAAIMTTVAAVSLCLLTAAARSSDALRLLPDPILPPFPPVTTTTTITMHKQNSSGVTEGQKKMELLSSPPGPPLNQNPTNNNPALPAYYFPLLHN